MSGLTREQRDELDARIRAIDWTGSACAYGSEQRMRVAAWAVQSGLIEDQVQRIFPNPGQAERMVEWLQPRLMEKITGMEIVSNRSTWNEHNLWDPTRNTSFCGWLRRLTVAMGKANPERILRRPERDMSAWDDDEGHNPVLDTMQADMAACGLFDQYPNLQVPRPAGVEWVGLWRRLKTGGTSVGETLRRLRDAGLWDGSLDLLEPRVAIVLMLAPIPRGKARLLPGMFNDDMWRQTAHAYWPSQTGSQLDEEQWDVLRRRVEETARGKRIPEWHVWRVLGTNMARLLTD